MKPNLVEMIAISNVTVTQDVPEYSAPPKTPVYQGVVDEADLEILRTILLLAPDTELVSKVYTNEFLSRCEVPQSQLVEGAEIKEVETLGDLLDLLDLIRAKKLQSGFSVTTSYAHYNNKYYLRSIEFYDYYDYIVEVGYGSSKYEPRSLSEEGDA